MVVITCHVTTVTRMLMAFSSLLHCMGSLSGLVSMGSLLRHLCCLHCFFLFLLDERGEIHVFQCWISVFTHLCIYARSVSSVLIFDWFNQVNLCANLGLVKVFQKHTAGSNRPTDGRDTLPCVEYPRMTMQLALIGAPIAPVV